MTDVKLIYFSGCPNAEKARSALEATKIPFAAIEQTALTPGSPYRLYSSPTILNGETILYGSKSGDGGGCSLDTPTSSGILEKLAMADASNSGKAGFFTTFGSIGSAVTVWFCPACIPAVSAFLSSVGLGIFTTEAALLPILIGFLALSLAGLFWSYLKEHGKIGPLILGSLAALALYLGRYAYIAELANQLLTYAGIAGMIVVTIWNLKLRRACLTCEAPSMKGQR
ncbi:MAG: MerC family mercury resistance protein [Bdellovibrionales bacterium]